MMGHPVPWQNRTGQDRIEQNMAGRLSVPWRAASRRIVPFYATLFAMPCDAIYWGDDLAKPQAEWEGEWLGGEEAKKQGRKEGGEVGARQAKRQKDKKDK